MDYLPLLAFVIVIALLITMAGRARRKQAATQAAMAERIGVGTDVMTTSGLYGTVVSLNGDDTVQLSIAPGLEVKWELAALRDVASLPTQFRGRLRAGSNPGSNSGSDSGAATGGPGADVDLRKDESGQSTDPR